MPTTDQTIRIQSALPLAIQHVVAMVVSCITVPVILSTAANLPEQQRVILMQASLFCAALAILIHAIRLPYLGSGLPVMVASGFAFIPTLTSIATTNGGMSAVLGAQLVGALAGILFALIFRHIRFLFPRVVTASVVITIGISLYSTAVRYMAGGVTTPFFGTPKSWMTALVTLGVVILCMVFGNDVIKRSSTLIGLIGGLIFAACIGIVRLGPVREASFFALPQPLYFGLNFSLGAIIPMVIIFLINDIQDIGQFEATAHGAYGRPATNSEITGGLIANCSTSAIGAVIGGVPNATCGQNVGIVVTTGITARLVFLIASALVFVTAFVPKIAAFFLAIPYPVLGGATVMVFGSIAMTGMKMLSTAGFTARNLTIAGLSIALAVGLAQNPNAFQQCPEWVASIFGRSEVVIVAILSIFLNLILPQENTPSKEAVSGERDEAQN